MKSNKEYNIKETAEILKVSVSTIRSYYADGYLRISRKNPGRNGKIFFNEESINEFYKSCTV